MATGAAQSMGPSAPAGQSRQAWLRHVRHSYGREAVKLVLGRILRWKPMVDVREGWSIVLGTPWALRHLLEVNLRFVAACDLTGLREIFVPFDRTRQVGSEEFIAGIRARFPDLPLTFLFYPDLAGRIVERVNVSTFYNSMNTVTALARCTTRHAIMHDFDLYPLVPHYFTDVIRALRERNLRFSGLELTRFDGLTDDDRIIGTWCLGVDVQWLRASWRPIDCFHKTASVGGRRINLDPYSYIQTRTPERALAGSVGGDDCCHVKNLCSTYLRFTSGRPYQAVWRLHYLWYLEDLSGMDGRVGMIREAMERASTPVLKIDGRNVDFSSADPTCANVLRGELERMDAALFGHVRPVTSAYVDAFARFLARFGAGSPSRAAG